MRIERTEGFRERSDEVGKLVAEHSGALFLSFGTPILWYVADPETMGGLMAFSHRVEANAVDNLGWVRARFLEALLAESVTSIPPSLRTDILKMSAVGDASSMHAHSANLRTFTLLPHFSTRLTILLISLCNARAADSVQRSRLWKE